MATTDLKVLIVGAGIAGLSAAIALELAGFEYTILEESLPPLKISASSDPETTPSPATPIPTTAALSSNIGAAVQVSPTALHFLHQLGIYEEIQKMSKPVSGFSMNEHDMTYVGRIDYSTFKERYGYHTEVMARSQLHSLLLQRIPTRRLVPGKVLGMIQDKDKVTIRCSDGTTHEGDVLIAADGGFSNVRHTLYWTMEEKKKLPKQDMVPMSVDLQIISGCTKPLDPLTFPVLLDAMTEIQSVQVPDKPYAIWFMPLMDNRIAWDITREVTKVPIRQGEASKVNNWRQEDMDEILEAVKKYDCPYGGQIGDLIETTPADSMYMHMSEERFCETWYGGRTALIGDACHKGFYQPVSEAIVDAVTLVNLLSDIQSTTMADVTAVFKEYRDRRAPYAKSAVEYSNNIRGVFSGKSRSASLKRNMVFNYMPEKVRNLLDDKRHESRPQLWFLPQVKDSGSVKPTPNLPPATVVAATTPSGPVKEVLEPVTRTSTSSTTSSTSTASSPASSKKAATTTTRTATATTVLPSSTTTRPSLTKTTSSSSTSSSPTSSPRNSRTSWSTFSRPAFGMPSAPNVPLFSTTSPPTHRKTFSSSSTVTFGSFIKPLATTSVVSKSELASIAADKDSDSAAKGEVASPEQEVAKDTHDEEERPSPIAIQEVDASPSTPVTSVAAAASTGETEVVVATESEESISVPEIMVETKEELKVEVKEEPKAETIQEPKPAAKEESNAEAQGEPKTEPKAEAKDEVDLDEEDADDFKDAVESQAPEASAIAL